MAVGWTVVHFLLTVLHMYWQCENGLKTSVDIVVDVILEADKNVIRRIVDSHDKTWLLNYLKHY